MSTGVQTAIGKFVWHEHSSTDLDRAKSFYTKLLGWETEVWKPGEMDYPMIEAGDQMHGGFSTAQVAASPHWVGHVLVTDTNETARRAEAAGGRIAAGPMDIPEIGTFAFIADPQGAIVSAFAPEGEMTVSEGTFVWDELQTSDLEAAKSFYTETFGWTAENTEMAGVGTYTVFKVGDTSVAGCTRLPEAAGAQAYWVPYVSTDVDATVARARELGGNVVQESLDLAEVGRIAVLRDPMGAVVGLWQAAGTQE